MNLSNLPSLRAFLKTFWQQNRQVLKKYRFDLTFFFVLTLGIWIVEILWEQYSGFPLRMNHNIPIVGGLPTHYLPEWIVFFFLGRLAAEIKTGIPTSLVVSMTYCLTILFGLVLSGFSEFWLLFFILFLSPFLIGYLTQNVRNHLRSM